jgi:hypothetical protein
MNRIISAEPLPECRLKVVFADGASGIFAVEPVRRGGVFLKLLDPQVFNAITVNPDFGCVEWPGGIDLCPDAMRQAMFSFEPGEAFHAGAVLREGAERNPQAK